VALPEFNTPYLNDYMRMVEETESPRLFHIWSAIGGMAATLGRRCFLPFGPLTVFANHYVMIVGSPASRKSTASSIMKRNLKSATGVRFAPTDTAGARQGLVEAMKGQEAAKEFLGSVELAINQSSLMALSNVSDLAKVTNEPEPESEAAFISAADKHHIMVVSPEFSQFMGTNNTSMMDFLVTMWDGEDYDYQTKTGLTSLKNPLINIVACTTPTMLARSLPPEAGGQGFLSRFIMVYGDRKYKKVPRPTVPPMESVDAVRQHLDHAYYSLAGAFDETPDAKAHVESLYDYALEINDPRFGYYSERRYTHLLKLSMVLAAGRGSQIIVKDDYIEAHRILRATEKGMPDALGEFGMNPLASLKQAMLEYCRSQHALPLDSLRAVFHRDSRSSEFMEALNDLMKMKQIVLSTVKNATVVSAVTMKRDVEDMMFKALAE